MGQIVLLIPQIGALNATEAPKVASDFTTLQTVINGNLDTTNLAGSAGIVLAQLAPGVARFNQRSVSTSATLSDGDCATVTTGGVAVTLPSAVAGAWCAIHPNNTITGASPVTIQRQGSDVINGPGLVAATSFVQGSPNNAVVMFSPAAGNWGFLAGKPDTGWVSLTLPTNWTAGLGAPYVPAVRVVGSLAYLSGTARNATGGSAAFSTTLPTFAVPSALVNLPTVTSTGVSNLQISLGVLSGGTILNGNVTSFDGLVYRL